ncbi:hypothetical protein ASPFODRAFT_66019 [Aspergillus luchuensis CBS 106.47]|uniref:Uncharacterized protein n=1 Tax=Aspergillus luchuensis (strain CBS 106.47) TaxID=1137211 RepID=A0A1M3SZ99_ASPLC|nr:hypothetical protein ASPFODRAFT_66019 [Aspergillus luchuensis CBS 106.47]
MIMIPNKNKKKTALKSVGVADFEDIVFNVQNPSQETALKLFDVLRERHNQRDGDKTSKKINLATRRKTGSYFHEAIAQIHGMENLSCLEAMMNAAVVGWDDLYREWLEREKNLRSDVQRYRFAQYLGRSLHYNSSEIRTNSAALRQFDRMLASRVNSIIREIQETRARNEIASITVWVRSLKEVRASSL